MEPEPLMTLEDIAAYLQLHLRAVSRLAKKGELPVMKIGRVWRVKREVLDRWITEQSVKNVVMPFPDVLDTATE